MTTISPRAWRSARPIVAHTTPRPRPETPPVNLHGHIPALDGIRGLAILMVMLLHFIGHMVPTTPLERGIVDVLNFGRLGVALFFVLSGFLITGILIDAKGRSGFFRNFYMRRALRIFPLYYAVLVFVFVVAPAIPALRGQDLQAVRNNQGWAWFYGVNVLLAKQGEFVMPYMNHFWSLAVEEHFYFVWPLVVWACSRETLVKVTVAVAVASMLLSTAAAAAGASEMALYVFTPFRLDGLCLGAFLAAWGRGPDGSAALARLVVPLAATAAGVIVATLAIGHLVPVLGVPFHEMRKTMFDLLFAVLIARTLTAPRHALSVRCFESRALCWLGVYSYGLYVLHHFVSFYFVRHQTEFVVERWLGSSHLLAVLLQALVGSAVSIVAAIASYRWLESPFLALKERWAPAARRPASAELRPVAEHVAPAAMAMPAPALTSEPE